MIQKIKPGYWFLIAWLAVCTYTGIWKYFSYPPDGIHQGAQTDRACIAWNYYDGSMNFFKPRVMENRQNDGVVGMEFPIVNYIVALLYKVFGPHEIIYRGLVFLIVSIGLYAVWLISGFFIRRTTTRIILVLSWFLSPIYLFYSFSFIPDPVSMSFGMLAMYFFLRAWFQISVRKSLINYLLFISLAGLIKVTFLILHFTAFAILFLHKMRPDLLPGKPVMWRRSWLLFLLPLLPVFGWYSYSRWLINHTGNTHFMQHINPAGNMSEVWEFTRYAFNTWHNSIYAPYIVYGIIALFLLVFFTRRKEAPLPALLAMISFLGAIAVFILFQFQFKYHDYYWFIFYPCFFFMLLFVEQVFLEGKTFFYGVLPVLFIVGFYIMPFYHLNHSKKMIAERYKTDSYYYQPALRPMEDYAELSKTADSVIPKGATILFAFDPTPNASLYFLRRKGLRTANDFSPEMVSAMVHDGKVEYLIVNDSALWEEKYQPVLALEKTLVRKKGVISIWKLGAKAPQD